MSPSRKRVVGFWLAGTLGFLSVPLLRAQDEPTLIAVSVDIVEISGSSTRDLGFSWSYVTPQGQAAAGIGFIEKEVPGIIRMGDFGRQTLFQTTLRALEQEGKAQILSNPKVIAKDGTQALFEVGGKFPIPTVGPTGTPGFEMQNFGLGLAVIPEINPDKKDSIKVTYKLDNSQPDASQGINVGGTSVPGVKSRHMEGEVELSSGETLVIGGLKSSTKNVTKARIPFLGRIPLLGLLFTSTSMDESHTTLYLFLSLEIVK